MVIPFSKKRWFGVGWIGRRRYRNAFLLKQVVHNDFSLEISISCFGVVTKLNGVYGKVCLEVLGPERHSARCDTESHL